MKQTTTKENMVYSHPKKQKQYHWAVWNWGDVQINKSNPMNSMLWNPYEWCYEKWTPPETLSCRCTTKNGLVSRGDWNSG